MSKVSGEIVRVVHVRLTRDEDEIFQAVANHLGLRNDAEVLRYLIKWFYNENRNKIEVETKRFEHFNLDVEKGIVRVLDRKQRIIADVYFRRKGEKPVVWCEWDNQGDCEHVKYALTIPKVKEALKRNGVHVE